jgi:hypothetical protein
VAVRMKTGKVVGESSKTQEQPVLIARGTPRESTSSSIDHFCGGDIVSGPASPASVTLNA